jgi:hypothetical protein
MAQYFFNRLLIIWLLWSAVGPHATLFGRNTQTSTQEMNHDKIEIDNMDSSN